MVLCVFIYRIGLTFSMVRIRIFRVTTAFVTNNEILTKDSTRFLPENIFEVIHFFDISSFSNTQQLDFRVKYVSS